MYNNTNPAEIYPGTTWELVTAGKYIQSGNTALSTGGSNSVSIAKANLPNIKLKTDTVSATISSHFHRMRYQTSSIAYSDGCGINFSNSVGLIAGAQPGGSVPGFSSTGRGGQYMEDSGSGNTGSISSSTEVLGSGTALTIQPAYITLKFWKRLT